MTIFVKRLIRAASGVVLFWAVMAQAEGGRGPVLHHDGKTAEVLLLSDPHFDPFNDPEKFAQLRSTPVEGWQEILNAPASSGRTAAFDALQTRCKARGEDSSWTLLRNSLQSAKLRAPKASFVTVGGDLLVHGFDCRLRALAKDASEEDVSAFAEKTVAFVALQMHHYFPGIPVYMTLGNNDSGCADYRETSGSTFLKSAGQSFAADVPANGRSAESFAEFSQYGDYSVSLPWPLQNARLIVMQDIFLSERYMTCGGKKLLAPDVAQNDWLREQLERARTAKEHVWVMAHIPPGVDVYSSFHKYVLEPSRMCEVKTPTMFLHSDGMTETLASFPDVVQVALFGHTHMDEIKLLHKAGEPASAKSVAAKVVPSLSPVNGNRPAFLVAQVSATTGGLLDYTAYVASDGQGVLWLRSYSFRSTYGASDFSAGALDKLTADMRQDRNGTVATSRTYRQWFLPGDNGLIGLGLQQVWPAYSCSASETTPADFERCLCGAPAEKPKAEAAK